MTTKNAFTLDKARALTKQIRDAQGKLDDLLIDAWRGRIWVTLGYTSWDTYCQQEFKGLPILPPRDHEVRRAVIQKMRDAGMSQRAIAEALGLSQATVSRDSNESPADESAEEPTTGVDGKTYRKRPPPRPKPTRTAGDELNKMVESPRG